jgi:hypothetical protein
MGLELTANAAQSTTTGSIDGSTDPVTFSVTSAASFPTTGNFRVLIDNEILLVTSVAGAAFTASRQQEGTSIASHLLSATVTEVLTKTGLATLISEGTRPYPLFVPAGVDDEFNNGSFTGWTLVDDGSHQATVTETFDVASLSLPGSDTAAHLHAWVKGAVLVNTNDYIQMAFRGTGQSANFNMCGLIMADGNTYGAGAQVCVGYCPSQNNFQFFAQTNYNTQGTNNTYTVLGTAPIFLRLIYLGSNHWATYISADGISWLNISGTITYTLTPAYVGFWATSWGATTPFNWSLSYFRKFA